MKNCFAGVLEKIGIEPQVQRIGKYKSAGDQLTRKNISDENRETLTALLDNIYGNWVEKISLAKGNWNKHLGQIHNILSCNDLIHYAGKKREDIVSFIDEGVFEINSLKEDGWITDIKYDDEVQWVMCRKHCWYLIVHGLVKCPRIN